MAMNRQIEPTEQPDIQTLSPKWPNMESLDLTEIVFSYNRDTDTLMLHFYGRGRAASSEPVNDYAYLRVDPETEEVVGLQIEDFLYRAIKEYPVLVNALSFAELRGITPEEVNEAQRGARRTRQRVIATLRQSLLLFAREEFQQRKRKTVRLILSRGPFASQSLQVN